MVMSGIRLWKWPKEKEKFWYDLEDVVEKINEPKPVNKRGIFCCPEIDKYSSFT